MQGVLEMPSEWETAKADLWKDEREASTLHPLRFHRRCCLHLGIASWDSYRQCQPDDHPGKKIRYVGEGSGISFKRLLSVLEGKRVLVVGDSVSRQWFEALICYLGITWTGWLSDEDMSETRKEELSRIIGKLPHFKTGQVAHTCIPIGGPVRNPRLHRHRQKGARRSKREEGEGGGDMQKEGVRKVNDTPGELCYYSTNGLQHESIANIMRHHRRPGSTMADLVIIDPGAVHHNYGSVTAGRTILALHSHIEDCIRSCKEFGLRCIFKEATPQHFLDPDGEFTSGVYHGNQTGCVDRIVNTFMSTAKFRNEIVRTHVIGAGLELFEVFDALMPRGDMHMGNDCTHFTFDANVWEPLHIQLYLKLSNAKNTAS